MAEHRTGPDPTLTRMPGGIPYIVGNEAAERFSFYGMKAILVVFMTEHLLGRDGQAAYMSNERATAIYHLFAGAAYFFPIIGSVIADVFWGKYKTILLLSLLYCVGHGCLAVMDIAPVLGTGMAPWMYAGLLFIAIGAGAIKPCVSAHVGDQFGTGNKHLITMIFNWFYFSINLGAGISSLLTPYLLERFGPWFAFGLPGVLMAIATIVFWMGRHRFIHVPPAGWKRFRDETFSPEGKQALRSLAPLFLVFVPLFWAMYDQTGSSWVLQAENLNRDFLGVTWLKAQVQFVNPTLILLGIPLFAYVVYPLMGKLFDPTPLRKIGIGLALCGLSFALLAWLELRITNGEMPSIGWQFLSYLIMTGGEIMVSIVCLEFAYTQSPTKMKSFIMGVYFLGVSLGNLFTSGVNWALDATKVEGETTFLAGANYYWFFAGLMVLNCIAYVLFAKYFYRGRTYIQGED